ncbi:cytosolic Fe-S cluster assembly factor NUBP1 isoform X2 [Varanus komodoensis]|nr:cytosolic Fe-S cluster assembly factor NUBP1 isoform X2 [Varanus komodoensis]XP_044289269.1 cytosolic Fe-S cluster assembly factor NUBP1 isoform X2 [Varanus komodoensis]
MDAGKSCPELLKSDLDPSVLLEQIGEAAALATEHTATLISEDADVFYTVESDESGQEICHWSDMGEAYDKIAVLAEYVLEDQQEKPVEEFFDTLAPAEEAAGCTEGCPEAKRRCSCSDSPEPKRRKLAHPPALCILNGGSVALVLEGCPEDADAHPNLHVELSVTTVSPVGRPTKAFGPPPGLYLEYRLPVVEDIQVIVAFEPAAEPPNLPEEPGAVWPSLCPGEEAPGKEGQPVCSQPACKRLESVDAFCTRLRRHVRASCGTVPEARGLPLDRLYVEGELVQCPPEGWSGRSTGEPEERARAAVGHGQLLRAPGRSSPASRVAVLLGRAGLGKSLLAQKICLDWAVGKLPQFDFAFRFDCRALSLLRGGGCPGLGQLLGLAAGLGEVPEEVVGHVSRNPGKALLVFDSLEELLEQDGLPPGADGPARREPCGGVRAMVAGLFQKKLLAGCTLLATARPRDKLHQYVPRVDTLLETPGFSVPQAESFLARYFEGCPGGSEAASSIRNSPYLFSHCHNPELCRFLCESASAVGAEQLPPTLTGLFAKSLLRKLARLAEKEATATGHLHIRALAQVAWTLGQAQQNAFLGERFPSAEVEAFALQAGLVAPLALPRSAGGGEEACGYVFSSFVAQNFLVALHLVLAKEVKDKGLTKHLHLLSKSRKFLSSWDLVPRFLSGLLFLEDGPSCALLFGEDMEVDTEKMVAKKQKSLLKYFRKLSLKSLSPEKLLELLHCIHETENPYLLQHLALELGPDLSFLGFPLTPADVHVLHSAVRRATKAFTLDLRGSCIDTEGLRRLLCLRNVAAFRASLSTAIQLWKHLWEAGAGEQLRAATQKFSVAPFKVSTMRDVEELSALVHLQEEMREGQAEPAGGSTLLIPAVAELRKLEFAVGPGCGPNGFQALLGLLDAFPALRHLDLDSPDENNIGDEGVCGLGAILPRLRCLETLNLSRNKVTDMGAAQLAGTLPTLPSLKTLSLYKNNIGDAGAAGFAQVLPRAASLRVLDIHCNKITAAGAQLLTTSLRDSPHIQSVALWSPTIPHGVLDYLQQLDSRIRLL